MFYINGALTLYGAWQQEVLLAAEFLVGGMAQLCCWFFKVCLQVGFEIMLLFIFIYLFLNIKYISKYRLNPPKTNSQTHPREQVFGCNII